MANKAIEDEKRSTALSLRQELDPTKSIAESTMSRTERRKISENDMSHCQVDDVIRLRYSQNEPQPIARESDLSPNIAEVTIQNQIKEQNNSKFNTLRYSKDINNVPRQNRTTPSYRMRVCPINNADSDSVALKRETKIRYQHAVANLNRLLRKPKIKTSYVQQKHIDRYIYSVKGSLECVPYGACRCRSCKEISQNSVSLKVTRDENGICRTTTEGLSDFCLSAASRIHHPRMSEKQKRTESFQNEYFQRNLWPDQKYLVEAGFFSDGISIHCFSCSLEFRAMNNLCDPFREHARWCPCCPFIRNILGDGNIHEILQDTREIYEAHLVMKDTINSSMIEALQNYYHPQDIKASIEIFFEKYGGYPNIELLSEMLENDLG